MDHSDDPSDDANRKPAARTAAELQIQQQLQAAAAVAAQQQQRQQQQWPYQPQQQQQQFAAQQAAAVAALPQQQQQQQPAAAFPLPAAAAAVNQQYSTRQDRPQQQQQQQQLLFQQQQVEIQQMIAQNQQQFLNAAVLQGGTAAGQPSYFPAAAAAAAAAPTAGYPQVAVIPQPYLQAPRPNRLPAERPLIKLSVSLIDTYKNINTVYYQERDARRAARSKSGKTGAGGTNNNGWDDENYDYIITTGELFYGRYKIKERIGKGSFGQVVRAEDMETHREVAIKIIKSKKPFLMQAKTEIELLTHLWEKDPHDQHNIVRLLTHFMYRNHQCLVFEMLSLNLYELLKNTQFGGVSLNLIRKFAKQVLKALAFLAENDVDIIHCDLKPENILLRHPKKSGVKVIDFGSSCRSNKRMYSYIQSRFYRSPEVILGLPYGVPIDMWSLGCILAEMHTGEPLFSGSDQFDQMQKIVKLLGMVPTEMLDRSASTVKTQFFEKKTSAMGLEEWKLRQTKKPSSSSKSEATSPTESSDPKEPIIPSTNPIASLTEVITAGNRQKKKFPPSEAYNSQRNYELFIDLVYKMLAYRPEDRIKPLEALNHPFIVTGDQQAHLAAAAIAQQTKAQQQSAAP